MATKQTKTNATHNWMTEFQTTAGGDRPYLWRTEPGARVDITVRPRSYRREDPDEIHRYRWVSIEMEYGDGWIREEIPFWARDSFHTVIADCCDGTEDEVNLVYIRRAKRVNDQTVNKGDFEYGGY